MGMFLEWERNPDRDGSRVSLSSRERCSEATFGIRREKPCSKRKGICSKADGVTSNPIGIPNQLMVMRLSYPQLEMVLFTAPSLIATRLDLD